MVDKKNEKSNQELSSSQIKVAKNINTVELENILNELEGEVVSIIPNMKNASIAQIYGLSGKVDYLLIIEKKSEPVCHPNFNPLAIVIKNWGDR